MKYRIVFILLFFISNIKAQQITHQNNIWLHVVEKAMFTKKWSLTFEGTFRFAKGFEQPQQFFVRPSIDYKFSPHFTASVGYSYYNTYSYGDVPINKTSVPEHHGWIQGQYTYKWKKLTIMQRLRDENRSVGVAAKDSTGSFFINHFEYRNRVRYMLSLTYPILLKGDKPILNGILADEAFFNVGDFSGSSLMNQNRLIAGFGYIINPNTQFQFCYIHQNVWNKANTIEEVNPTLRLSFIHQFNWLHQREKNKN